MATKIQIDVIGKLENSQFVKCKLYIDGEATRILMPETEYHCLIQEGFFVRDGEECDSAGVINTTKVYECNG